MKDVLSRARVALIATCGALALLAFGAVPASAQTTPTLSTYLDAIGIATQVNTFGTTVGGIVQTVILVGLAFLAARKIFRWIAGMVK